MVISLAPKFKLRGKVEEWLPFEKSAPGIANERRERAEKRRPRSEKSGGEIGGSGESRKVAEKKGGGPYRE